MDWWKALIEVFKVGAAAKTARDQRKAGEALLAQEAAAMKAAQESTDASRKQMLMAQADVAKLAYSSLTTPGSLQAAPSSASPLDAFLPFIIVGLVALTAFAMFKK